MLRDSAGAAQRLSRVVTMSRFVSQLLERVPESVAWLDDDAQLAPRALAELDDEISAIVARHDDVAIAAKAIRGVRRRELLRIALASVLDLIEIEALGVALTDISTATVRGAVDLARRDVSGIEFAVIGMGRFGGSELGFSSDLDVMWVFRDAGLGDEAHRAAERIVKSVNELTEDMRFPIEIDANLRPEGKNGPIVRSLDAYRAYYERWGDTWETQALVRSRPVAGDISLQRDFEAMADALRYTQPLSENGLREIRRIKARVETERLPMGEDPNRNLKLGRGSLSDVEWLVQVIQLQHGVECKGLRTPSTLAALSAAVEQGILGETDAQTLRDAWLMASRIRSAITLWSARNSDALTANTQELEGIARVMAYPAGSARQFEDDYLRVSRRARQAFERLFYPTV
jgi:glutamate-ammonia-ligase adenylyltransferase